MADDFDDVEDMLEAPFRKDASAEVRLASRCSGGLAGNGVLPDLVGKVGLIARVTIHCMSNLLYLQ